MAAADVASGPTRAVPGIIAVKLQLSILRFWGFILRSVFVVSTSEMDILERLISETMCYLSSVMWYDSC